MSNHDELVQVAAKWLRNARRCRVVLTELVSAIGEVPDAIGWQNGRSILVECKTSRADFRADQSKPWRRYAEMAVGVERWYLTPPGLLTPNMLPPRWGLLEWNGRFRRIVKKPARRITWQSEVSMHKELLMLTSELSRYQKQGIRYLTIAAQTAGIR